MHKASKPLTFALALFALSCPANCFTGHFTPTLRSNAALRNSPSISRTVCTAKDEGKDGWIGKKTRNGVICVFKTKSLLYALD